MKVEFNRHSDTSLGRAKIGDILDLPTAEAKAFIASKVAIKVGGKAEVVTEENFFVADDEGQDAG